MKLSPLVVTGVLFVAVACGRTGLESDLVESDGASAEGGDGGSGGRGSGGRAVSGGSGGAGGSGGVGTGAVGGGVNTGGGGNLPGVGGSFGGSFDGGTGGVTAGQPGVGGTLMAGAGGQPIAGQGGTAGSAGMPPLGCGDGVLDPGEACDPGDEPAPPALELRQGGFTAEVLPVVGVQSANQFYAYDSASGHTGFEVLLGSRLYLYRWNVEEALSLVMHHGIDEESSGLVQPESAVTFDIAGLPDTGVVSFSDEPNEFYRSTPTTAHADWTFRRNTDGGVLAGLPFPGSWHLIVSPQFFAGVDSWMFYSGSGQPDLGVLASHELSLAAQAELVSSDQPGDCRADCTIPVCGDARLDPGEVCDDGNDADGDGCSGCRPELP